MPIDMEDLRELLLMKDETIMGLLARIRAMQAAPPAVEAGPDAKDIAGLADRAAQKSAARLADIQKRQAEATADADAVAVNGTAAKGG